MDKRQYELIERTLKEAIHMYGEQNWYPVPLRSCLCFFQRIYYKKTQRYVLTGQALRKSTNLLSEVEVLEDINMRVAQVEIEGVVKIIYHPDERGKRKNR